MKLIVSKIFAICICCVCLLIIGQPRIHAQLDMLPLPHDDWRSVQTEHFNVHYPLEVEEWTLEMVDKLESIHEAVTTFVGYYEVDEPVHVVVHDPAGLPNGMAIPFGGAPRIVLWPDAPVNPLMLGGLENWNEIVMVHEYTHAVHLTRRSRNWQGRLSGWLLPVRGLAMKLPLWATEGFAVYAESQLTGYGRTQSSLRSMIICQLAVEGKLPEYSELNGADAWMGGRYPYFVGSAFLQWLMARHSDSDCLLHLWKRLTAEKNRSFDEAFTGVFQDSPEDLYDRFRAEVTLEALLFEKETVQRGIIEGVPWLYHEGMTGKPDVSPDGDSLVFSLSPEKELPYLTVMSLLELEENDSEKDTQDTEDVPDLPDKPPQHKKLHTLQMRNNIVPANPKWMPDGKSILFQGRCRSSNGNSRNDIFRWFPETNSVKRLTHGAALCCPEPLPGGKQAICLYRENGLNAIVIIDLETAAVKNLTPATISPVWQSPDTCPQGKNLVVVKRQNHKSELVTISINDSTMKTLYSNDREVILNPVFTPDGERVLFCSDHTGVLNVMSYDLIKGQVTQITRSMSGVLASIPMGNDQLMLLKHHSKGINLNLIEKIQLNDLDPSIKGQWKTVTPPSEITVPEAFKSNAEIEKSTYSPLSNLEYSIATGGSWLPNSSSAELSLNLGDVLGQFNTRITGGYGWDGAPKGVTASVMLKPWPVHVTVAGFTLQKTPSDQKDVEELLGLPGEMTLTGGEISTYWKYQNNCSNLIWETGVSGAEYEFEESNQIISRFDRMLIGTDLEGCINGSRNKLYYGLKLSGNLTTGETDDETWSQYKGSFGAYIGWDETAVRLKYKVGGTSGDPTSDDLFSLGGVLTSLEPAWLNTNRVEIPWLPEMMFSGKKFEKIDLEIVFGQSSPLVLFATEVNAWNEIKPDPQRAVGIEFRSEIPDLPLFRVNGFHFLAGGAYGLDGLIEDDWKGYISFRLLP